MFSFLSFHSMCLGKAGKQAMIHGVSMFNIAASNAYKALEREQKERLEELSIQPEGTQNMTVREVKKAGAKVFKKIQMQVGLFIESTLFITYCAHVVQNSKPVPTVHVYYCWFVHMHMCCVQTVY